MLKPYKSETKSVSAGQLLTMPNWVPEMGPNGGLLKIHHLEIIVTNADINVATAVIQGEDVWRALGTQFVVEQLDGKKRWNMPGDAVRLAVHQYDGPQRVPEFADVAASANQSVEWVFQVPLAKRHTFDEGDFAMLAAVFKHVSFVAPTGAFLSLGTSVVTIDQPWNYTIIAWCDEAHPGEVPFLSEDECSTTDFSTLTQQRLSVEGRLHDLQLYQAGANGGGSLANLTDVRIDGILPQVMTRAELREAYLYQRLIDNQTFTYEPVADNRVLPVLWAGNRAHGGKTSAVDEPIVGSCLVRLTNTVANLVAIHRVVTPKSAANAAMIARKFGAADLHVASAAKTKRNPGAWGDVNAAFLPMKAKSTKA